MFSGLGEPAQIENAVLVPRLDKLPAFQQVGHRLPAAAGLAQEFLHTVPAHGMHGRDAQDVFRHIPCRRETIPLVADQVLRSGVLRAQDLIERIERRFGRLPNAAFGGWASRDGADPSRSSLAAVETWLRNACRQEPVHER